MSSEGGFGELERAVAIAKLTSDVASLKERAAEDRVECERERERDRERMKAQDDAIAALRRFQAWLMGAAVVAGAIFGKALGPLIDKVFK